MSLQFKIEPFKHPLKVDPLWGGEHCSWPANCSSAMPKVVECHVLHLSCPLCASSFQDAMVSCKAELVLVAAWCCREDVEGAGGRHSRDQQPQCQRPQL